MEDTLRLEGLLDIDDEETEEVGKDPLTTDTKQELTEEAKEQKRAQRLILALKEQSARFHTKAATLLDQTAADILMKYLSYNITVGIKRESARFNNISLMKLYILSALFSRLLTSYHAGDSSQRLR